MGNTQGSAVAHSSFFCLRAYRQVNPALTKAKKSAFQHLLSQLVYTLHLLSDWVVGSSLTWSEPSAGGNIRKILTGFRSDEGEIIHTMVVTEVSHREIKAVSEGRRKLDQLISRSLSWLELWKSLSRLPPRANLWHSGTRAALLLPVQPTIHPVSKIILSQGHYSWWRDQMREKWAELMALWARGELLQIKKGCASPKLFSDVRKKRPANINKPKKYCSWSFIVNTFLFFFILGRQPIMTQWKKKRKPH